MSVVFDSASHTYYLDGSEVPSVTKIISGAKISDYSKIPREYLEAKCRLGQYVHKATELYDAGKLDEATIDEAIIPYLNAWEKFRYEHKAQVIKSEGVVFSKKLRYAGTFDRVLFIEETEELADIKTSLIEPWHKVQLMGYRLALKEMGHNIKRLRSVYLQPDGDYKSHTYKERDLKPDEACFLSALNVYYWKQNNKG